MREKDETEIVCIHAVFIKMCYVFQCNRTEKARGKK